jgi:cytochrome c oxidase assembly protein subunit 11
MRAVLRDHRRENGASSVTNRPANAALAIGLACVISGMVGASFAAIPLYRMFCAVTGYAGTPQVGGAAAPGAEATTRGAATMTAAPMMTVRFNADTNAGLHWDFRAAQAETRLKLGDQAIAFYTARNRDELPVTGIALYNVTPDKVGKYFHKTACFCFNRQTLNPGQEMEFPVTFWVDPAIATDPSTADVHTITLSYTFFRTLDDAAKTGALAKAGPHVGPYAGPAPPLDR